ncbi:hypothetical protein ACF071_07445 [Streptomyces albidoflavus]
MSSDDFSINNLSAFVSADGTGWASVLASPEWWRALADAPNLREILEQAAAVGEAEQDLSRCLAIGATTKRPCQSPREECPHHGEDSGKHRCGVIGANKRPCRWNTTVGGPCPNHGAVTVMYRPDGTATERTSSASQRRQMSGERTAREPRGKRAPDKKPIDVVCSHCGAAPGAKCRYPNGGETGFHLRRRKAAKQQTS